MEMKEVREIQGEEVLAEPALRCRGEVELRMYCSFLYCAYRYFLPVQLVMAALCAGELAALRGGGPYGTVMMAIFGVVLVYFIAMPCISYGRFMRVSRGNRQIDVDFGEKIVWRLGSIAQEIDYADVRRIAFARRVCAIVFGKNRAIPIPANGFAPGDRAALREFLQSKCPKARVTGCRWTAQELSDSTAAREPAAQPAAPTDGGDSAGEPGELSGASELSTSEAEPEFVCRYTISRKLYVEIRYRIGRRQRGLLAVGLALSAFETAWLISEGVFAASSPTLAVLCLIACMAPALLVAMAPLFQYERVRRNHAGRMQSQIAFGERIWFGEGRIKSEFEYGEVVRLFFAKRFCALTLKNRLAIIVSMDGFVRGDGVSFQNFIKAKCPGAKVCRRNGR